MHLTDVFQSGIGSTNVVFTFDANPGATRSGTLTIAGQTLTITQAGSTYISAQTMNTLVSSGLNLPYGVAVDGAGNLYIADSANNAIKKWTLTNHVLTTLVSSGLNNPNSVAVDGSGNVYVADTGNNAIKEWVAATSNLTTLVSTGLYSPSGVALDTSGNVYIADGHDEVIYEWILSNSNLVTLNSLSPPYLCGPPSVAVDIAGNAYFDDKCGDALVKWTAVSSNVTTLTPGWFYNPTGVAVDGSGNVYIADQADNWIWEWSAVNNTLTTVVAGFNRPGDVAVDSAGDLYIADTDNNAIKEFTQIFLDPTPKLEGLAAGSDFLPPVMPVSATQLGSFNPMSNQPWLAITGITNGVVYFSFSASPTNRSGIITMFGQSFPVLQRGSSVSLGLSTVAEGSAAGNDSVVLGVYPNTTAWTATANVGWLHLSATSQNGTGSTNVFFSYDANPGATRAGTLSIAGQPLTVTQAGSTYVAVNPVTTLVPSGGPGPWGVGVDGVGNVYYYNYYQHVTREWKVVNNTVTTLFASGSTSLTVDSVGNVYFSGDKWTAANNNVTTLVPSGFGSVAVDKAGNLYFPSGNSIQVMNPVGNVVTTLVSGLNGPGSVAVDAAGNIYFTSGYGIQEWMVANNTVTTLVPPAPYTFNDLAVDGAGNLYIVGQDSYIDSFAVMKWTAASNTLTTLVTSGQAEYFGVAVDGAGNAYFTDFYDGLVQERPTALLDNTPKIEGIFAGHDSLPAVLPTAINLLAPFAPSSDSTWLTITGITNGVVSFSFPTNFTLIRTGHINLLGQSISVTQTGPTFTLGTTNLFEGPAAGSDSVVLAVTPNFGIWMATTNVPWLHFNPANQNGTGSTNVVFSFDANPGTTRSGIITIAGQILTVTQAGAAYVQTAPLTALVASGQSGPSGVAVDVAGNVYIADTTNNVIEKWTATNNMLAALVSSGLAYPAGMAVDAAGNVYIADTGNSAIKEWTAASKTVTTLVPSGLSNPAGVAVDAAGNVYIADTGNSAIKEWMAANSNIITLAAFGLLKPAGVAVDISGNVYIADTGNSAIKKWVAASNTMTTLVSSGLSNPSGVAVDGSRNVYIADTGNSAIKELPRSFVNPTTMPETADAGNGALPAVLPATENLIAPFAPFSDSPWLTISGATNGVVSFSFTANFGSSRTAHISLLGQTIPVTQSGLTYSIGASSLLVGPLAGSNSVVLAVAPKSATWTATTNAAWLHLNLAYQSGTGSTNLVFSYDANTGATRSGTLSIVGQTLIVTQAGSTYVSAGMVGTLVSTGLSNPYGVAVDGAGNVYIADSFHSAIKEWVVTNGAVTTLVSTGLSNPFGVAVDSGENIYIADSFHSAIKEWAPAGSNTTALVSSGLNTPYGLAVGGTGNIYIADTFNNAIKEWTPANNNVATLVSSGLSNPFGIAVDCAGNVYIADSSHNAIKEWMLANNNINTLVASGLSNPYGVAVDGSGNVYIVDASHNSIKKWMPANNNVATLISSGLSNPFGVAVDGAGNVYIADRSNNAIKELPYAFVDPTAKLEGLAAGSDVLPVVLPATANLLTPFAPTSDQSWLTITGVTNGVVNFAFSTNMGPARTAHINLLNQVISITQGLIGTPPNLTGVQTLGNGVIQLSFTNISGSSFTVLATTNVALPLNLWSNLGAAVESPAGSGQFQFTDPQATNNTQRYYRVRTP